MSEDNTKCRAGCLCGISASQNSFTSHHSGFAPSLAATLNACRPILAVISCSHIGHASRSCRGMCVGLLQLKFAELKLALGNLQQCHPLL